MALSLLASLRRHSLRQVVARSRPSADEMEPDEVPHDFYVVKDYDKNPFYMSLVHVNKPGYKKLYDPFKKHAERQEHAWRPRYYGQLRDQGLGILQMCILFFLPFEFVVLYYWETRYSKHRMDPLGYNMSKPGEF